MWSMACLRRLKNLVNNLMWQVKAGLGDAPALTSLRRSVNLRPRFHRDQFRTPFMAKQRRPAQKLPKHPSDAAPQARSATPEPAAAAEATGSARRATYVEAVALYER